MVRASRNPDAKKRPKPGLPTLLSVAKAGWGVSEVSLLDYRVTLELLFQRWSAIHLLFLLPFGSLLRGILEGIR